MSMINLRELHWRTRRTMPAYAANVLTDAGVQLNVTDARYSLAVAQGFYDQAAMMLVPEDRWGRVEIGRLDDGSWFCQIHGLEEDGEGSSRALAIVDAAVMVAMAKEPVE